MLTSNHEWQCNLGNMREKLMTVCIYRKLCDVSVSDKIKSAYHLNDFDFLINFLNDVDFSTLSFLIPLIIRFFPGKTNGFTFYLIKELNLPLVLRGFVGLTAVLRCHRIY